MIVFAAIMPHPPESIPGIGNKGNSKTVKKTLHAFDELRSGIEQANPETIVIISPHAYSEQYSFVINSASELKGNFKQFESNKEYTYANDKEIIDKISFACLIDEELPVHLHQGPLDHGALIPLHYLTKNIKPKIVHLSFSLMNYEFHYRYGEILQKIVDDNTEKRVAIIASGDLSHRLSLKAPAGFSPKAQEFDRKVLRCLEENDIASLMKLDQQVVTEAAECGLRSFVILLGALHGKKYKFNLLSYESPMGVGYMTARLL